VVRKNITPLSWDVKTKPAVVVKATEAVGVPAVGCCAVAVDLHLLLNIPPKAFDIIVAAAATLALPVPKSQVPAATTQKCIREDFHCMLTLEHGIH
jgi:hypothetical protein